MVDRDWARWRGVHRAQTVYVAGQTFAKTIVYVDIAKALDQALSR